MVSPTSARVAQLAPRAARVVLHRLVGPGQEAKVEQECIDHGCGGGTARRRHARSRCSRAVRRFHKGSACQDTLRVAEMSWSEKPFVWYQCWLYCVQTRLFDLPPSSAAVIYDTARVITKGSNPIKSDQSAPNPFLRGVKLACNKL